MKKKFRPLIIALGALILVGAAYLLIVNLIPDPPEEVKESTEYLKLTEYELKGLDHVTFHHRDGYEFTLRLTHKSETSRTYSIDGKSQFDFLSSNLASAAMSLASISSSRLISENETNLAQYGLDDPKVVAEFEGTNGVKVKLSVGNDTPVGTYTYVMKDDIPNVYLLSSYSSRYLTQKDYAYRDLAFLSLNAETPVEDLKHFAMADHDEPIFAYDYLTVEEVEAREDLSTNLVMSYPFENQLNDSSLTDNLLTHLTNLNATEVVEDFPKDLARYGLDKDLTVLEWTLQDGTETKLSLSQPNEDGVRYGRKDGVDSVYAFKAEDFDFVSKFDYTKTLYRLLWMYNITELAGFDVTAHGETHEIRLFDPTKDEQEEGKEFWATIDGEPLREENCRRLYIRVLSPSIYDLTDTVADAAAEPDWSAVVHFDTGRADETIAFYRINARQYAAYRNGEPTGFYVNLLDLQKIDEALATIASGDLIPMS